MQVPNQRRPIETTSHHSTLTLCTCSDGEGVTARELAELIFKGKHDKVLETHGNALQEVITQYMSSTTERNQFLGLLQGIIQRLINVEQNGYRGPRDADYIVSEQSNRELPSITESQSDDLNSKKKTKKKKKKGTQQQQQHQGESNNSTGESAEPALEKKDVKEEPAPEDPLVEALQNMGFTLDQILTAAKACGGLERATADDIVAWIFGQQSGEVTAAIPPSETRPPPLQPEKEVKPRSEPPQPKLDAKAKAEAKLREEAAKRQEEARIAAQRLAAKREEARRRNREWNNKEQARQQEEAQAKLSAQALLRAKAEAQAALNVTPASLLLPQSIESAEKPPIAIIPPPPVPPVPAAPKPPPAVGPPAIANFVQPTRILKNPASVRPPNTRAVSLPTSPVPPTMIAEKRHHDPMAMPIMGVESMSLYGDYPEDATVSSYGSGVRSVASMPKQFQMFNQQPLVAPPPMSQPFLPPGLRPATAVKLSAEADMSAASYLTDPSLGDLRATAKSFTPSTFRSNAAAAAAAPVTNLHLGGGPAPQYPSANALGMPPLPLNSMSHAPSSDLPAFDNFLPPMRSQPAEQTGAPLRDPVSSLLTGPMLRPPGNPSMMTTPLQRGMANSFERGNNVTPSTVHSGSSSSMSRISSYDEPALPAPRAFGIANHKLPTGGPSILDSLQLGPSSSSSFGSGFATRDVGGATIWGLGGDAGGPGSVAPVAGRSLVGALPPLFLAGGGGGSSNSSTQHGVIGGIGGDNRPGNTTSTATSREGSGVWESSLGGSASTGGGSSIW